MKKMTHREILSEILSIPAISENPIYSDLIKGEIAKLEKRQGENRKPTKTQEANELLKQEILASMEDEKCYTITEMLKEFEALAGLTNQKVSALVRQMMENDKTVVKIIEKRTSYFKKA
jgi:hypothetical protein